MWQGCHLPLCKPLLTCFTYRPVCALAPPWNSNSCDPSHPTICQFLVVQRTTRQLSPFKINCLLDGKCDLPFKLTNISKPCHLRPQHSYRSTYTLYQCLGKDRLETVCLPHTLSNTVIPRNPNLIRSRTPFEFQIVRVPRQFFPFKIIETGLIRSWVPRTRIFKIILTVNTLDFKVKY